jgi:hypothetical protein
VRKLNENGHQTSILSTRYLGQIGFQASSMFARWHQENFFKYMRQHFGLDHRASNFVNQDFAKHATASSCD